MGGKLHRYLRDTVAAGLQLPGLLRPGRIFWRRAQIKKEICVFGLHRVLSNEDRAQSMSLGSIVLRERTFGTLLEYLAEHFEVLTLDSFLVARPSESADSRPRCILTFDDGWNDNYTRAFPLLKKYGIPAVIFLITELIGTPEIFWIEGLATAWGDPSQRKEIRSALRNESPSRGEESEFVAVVEYLKHMPAERRRAHLDGFIFSKGNGFSPNMVDRMMTWGQALEMSRNGVEFGAHTKSHPLLTYETDVQVSCELKSSKQVLEEKLCRPVRTFAYPNGDWDARVRELTIEAGYDCAFSTQPGWHRCGDDHYSIRRVMIHEGNVTGRKGGFSSAVFNLTLTRGG
jgi:peptidoglycan/xylan/chitin deacetylase (PgdA/CDA1 family)